MSGYQRFVAGLKVELEHSGIDTGPPRLGTQPLQSEASTSRRLALMRWTAAAAAVLLLGAIGLSVGRATITRRLVAEANRLFLEEVFERSLFEAGVPIEAAVTDWFEPNQLTGNLTL